jgi:hypothetical protein
MIRKALLAIFSILLAIDATAQTTISLGTFSGAGSTNVLLSTSTTVNRYSRTMSLYTASEIIAAGGNAGSITSLAWDKQGSGEYLTNDAYIKIYLKHTTDGVWSTAPVPDWDNVVIGATEVFTSNTFSLPVGTGWAAIPFTTPFVWNGTDNIVIMVEWDRASAPTGAINWGRSTNPTMNATRVGSNSLAALVMFVNGNRPLVQLTLGGSVISITDVVVTTQGGVPAQITTNGGTLQLEATVLPAGVNQNVNWSIVPGTGTAQIDANGLVTAQTNGTVWGKAVAVGDTTIMDSLQITMTNQIVPVTGILVSVQGAGLPQITTQGGTLQMEAAVAPANASQDVVWSIVTGTGNATINTTGLVTGLADGTVWAKAVSVTHPTIGDSLEITITNQSIGLTETRPNPIILYPNPVTSGVFTLSLPDNFVNSDARITIYSISGRVLLEQPVKSPMERINAQELPSGTYLLRYESRGQSYNCSFIVK